MKTHLLTLVLLAVSALTFGACTHVREATNDAVAWVRDALQTTVDAPLDRTVTYSSFTASAVTSPESASDFAT